MNKPMNLLNMNILSQHIGVFNSKKFNEILNTFYEDDENKQKEPVIKKKNSNYCKFCGEFECVIDEGGYVCSKCGKSNGEILDETQEWRTLTCDDYSRGDPSRVGMPINEHFLKSSLSTTISGWGGFYNFRRHQKFIQMDYKERSLLKNFQYIDTSADDSVSEAIKNHAKNLFEKISKNENKRGSKKHSNMAACIFYASEGRNITTNKDKLNKQFDINKKKFTKGCNFYREQLFEKEPEYYARMKPVSVIDEVHRIGKLLEYDEIYMNISLYVSYMAQELGIVIKNTPISIAVGSLFLVSTIYQLDVDKNDILDKCDISDVTINKLLTLLLSYKTYLIPTEKLYNKYMELHRPFFSLRE